MRRDLSPRMSADHSNPQAIVRLNDVGKVFGRFAALRGLSADFHLGKLYILLGENGAGKSTLLRMIAGLAAPTSGKVDVACTPEKVGFMSHSSFLYDDLSGAENLRYFAGLYSDPAPSNELMASVGLDPALPRRVRDYSQGMRQRLSLARALVNRPELLLLDEPFSNVDAASTAQMLTLLCRLKTSTCIILVTHQPALLDGIADQTLTLVAGRVAAQ